VKWGSFGLFLGLAVLAAVIAVVLCLKKRKLKREMLKNFWEEDPLISPNDSNLKLNKTGQDSRSTEIKDSRYE